MFKPIACCRLFVLLLAFQQPVAADTVGGVDELAWAALKSGRYVVLIRHAVTEAGIGDPPGFVLGDCSTQRNLSARGRSDAKRIGDAFRSRRIPVSEVLSSRWCRCLDTARLAFGKVEPAPMLDSMFNEHGKSAEEKVRKVYAAAAGRPASGNLVLVTHNQNILALTGTSVSSGELVIVTLEDGDRLKVIGRLNLTGG